MGGLTTHVLDTAQGRPAAGVRIEVFAHGPAGRQRVAGAVTNADGRCDAPLIAARDLRRGRYELEFHIGAYFAESGTALPDPPFLDVVSIAFGVASEGAHYHVPLLVSPYGYATYRGS
ncbi:MAG: hydroxyisourate hydrolase [Alphaproteobacteria bacterium]|nr:hydroxyisourate hydrolase [Alphaproteobacteria bacterium]